MSSVLILCRGGSNDYSRLKYALRKSKNSMTFYSSRVLAIVRRIDDDTLTLQRAWVFPSASASREISAHPHPVIDFEDLIK